MRTAGQSASRSDARLASSSTPPPSPPPTIARSAASAGAATLTSRILGVVREQVLAALAAGHISAGHARALVGSEHAVAYARQIIDRDLSVRDAERMVRNGAPPRKTRAPSPLQRSGDADTRALEGELSANLGMSVRIRHEPGHEGGELTIRYTRLDELDLLCRVLAVIPRDAEI